VRRKRIHRKTQGSIVKSRQPVESQSICQPYLPLQPHIDHIGQAQLPWKDSQVTELGIFELFWDEEGVGMLVERTNMCAEEKGAGKTRVGGGVAFGYPWRKVIPGEMWVFLALVIYIGAKRDCGSKTFWKEQEENRKILSSKSLKRFSKLKRYFHKSDPKLHLSHPEWFQKPKPLNSMIQSCCQQYYLPTSNVTVDEIMIRFGSRSYL